MPRFASLLRRRAAFRRSLWTGPAIHTLATKARAQATVGVHADSLVLHRYSIRAGFTYDLTRATAIPLVGKVLPYFVLAWAMLRYSEFHVFYNRGVLPQMVPGRFNEDELSLLRDRGIEVYFWAYGADVRTRDATLALGSPNCCERCPEIGAFCVCDERTGHENILFITSKASGCATMGDMALYTPAADASVYYWPVDLAEADGHRFRVLAPEHRAELDEIVVAHAPNNPTLKGTAHLEAAVETLRSEGVRVRLDLVSGVDNDTVLDRFRRADIVFDQCVVGFHGYTSLEAMAVGRPVLCFLRDPARDLAEPDACPIVNITPSTLTATLRELCLDSERRRQLGEQGRRYIELHHSLDAVGHRIEQFIATQQEAS
ncbi:MAG: glycosyltransferase [Actinomycetota bacterium]